MLVNYHADGQTFKFRPRPAQEFQFQFLFWTLSLTACAEAMARHASISESCLCQKLLLNPSNSLFKVDAPWMKRHKPNRLFRAQASLSKRLQTRLLKMPQMWRLLMRVEKRIMVTVTWSLIFNGARAHTKKHSALERLSSLPSVFSSTFQRSLFHDLLDTLALKGLSSATHAQPALE